MCHGIQISLFFLFLFLVLLFEIIKTKMDKKISHLFDALFLQVTDHDLVNKISEIQNLYENYLESGEKDPNFDEKWNDLKDKVDFTFKNKVYNSKKFELRSLTQTLQTVFQKISARSSSPNDTYTIAVKEFREHFQSLKQLLINKNFNDEFIKVSETLVTTFNNHFKKIFMTAKINPDTRKKLINSIEQSLNDFLSIVQLIDSEQSLPPAFVELSKLIDPEHEDGDSESSKNKKKNSLKNKKQNSQSSSESYDDNPNQKLRNNNKQQGSQSSSSEDEVYENLRKRSIKSKARDSSEEEEIGNDFDFGSDNQKDVDLQIPQVFLEEEEEESTSNSEIHNDISSSDSSDSSESYNFNSVRSKQDQYSHFLDDYMSKILTIANNLFEIAEQPKNSHIIKAEAQKLIDLSRQDLFQELNNEKKKLHQEIQRSREMISVLNKAQSMRTNISNKLLGKLSKDELMVLLQGFVANTEDIKVPLELTVSKGAPIEFKNLVERYKKAAKFNEEATNEIQRMNTAMIQLRSENQRLKCQAAAMSNEVSIHNELDQINYKIHNVKKALKSKHDESNSDSESQDEQLEDELNELNEQKNSLENQLKKCDKFDLHMQIEILKEENNEYQRIIEEKQKENEEMMAEMKALTQKIAKKDFQENKPVQQHQIPPNSNPYQQQSNLQNISPPQNISSPIKPTGINEQRNREKNRFSATTNNKTKSLKRELVSAYSQKNLRRKSWSNRNTDLIRENRPPFRS